MLLYYKNDYTYQLEKELYFSFVFINKMEFTSESVLPDPLTNRNTRLGWTTPHK